MDRMLYTAESKRFETGEGNACFLIPALFDLVQSAHLWFGEMEKTMLEYRLTQSKYESALFIEAKTELHITIYVEDIKAYAPIDANVDKLGTHILKKYKLTDLGDLK